MYALGVKSAGYSGTPLPKKLGLTPGRKTAILHAPPGYVESLGIDVSTRWLTDADLIQFFTRSYAELAAEMPRLRQSIVPNGAIWISWPKKASKVATDLDEKAVRTLALKHALVDIKICAVDEVWSGLKLVIPLALRDAQRRNVVK